MASNPYINKVVFGSDTLIDISDTDAIESDVAIGKKFYKADGSPATGTSSGGAGSAIIIDTLDSGGGTIRTITTTDEYHVQASKTATPTESQQTISPDTGYDALGEVTVGAISSTYVGSGITRRSSSDLGVSGATVTVPSGYYTVSSKTIPNAVWGNNTNSVVKQDGLFWYVREYPNFVPGYMGEMDSFDVSFDLEDKTVSPTESSQTVTPTDNECYLNSVTVNAISPSYVGSGITRRSSTDLTASGATVTVPAGYYSSAATKSVASGTEGTPTATKGTVSNHAISVTPSVTNAAGYISGGTKTGTAVSVSASELVSGTYSVTSSGTKDVTNYASASIPAGTEGTPSATKGTVSNHSVTVTPSVTNSSGFISGSTKTGTAVTVTASELASGNKEITQNGTNIDVVGYSTITVNVAGGGGGGSVTQDENGYIILPTTGGGGSAQTATGTFTGNGTITATISCSFAPDLILVHGDLSGTTSLRGVVHFLIIKDTESLQVVDGSSSAYSPSLYNEVYGISGYGGSSYPYATYSGTTLTLTMVQDTSSTRWTSGVTYSYTLIKWS